MAAKNTFQGMLSDFFLKYVPSRSLYSENTVKAYRDTFILLCHYHEARHKTPVSKIEMGSLDEEYIAGFMSWLGTDRHYPASSLNQRLAALHAFYRYVQKHAPEYMAVCQPWIG